MLKNIPGVLAELLSAMYPDELVTSGGRMGTGCLGVFVSNLAVTCIPGVLDSAIVLPQWDLVKWWDIKEAPEDDELLR